MKALVLSSSPRRNGNSALLAEAVREGLAEAGHEATFALRRRFPERLSQGLPEMPKAGRRVLDRGRLSLGLSRSLSAGRRLHRGDADLLVRHLGAAQGLPRSDLLLLRRLLSQIGRGHRGHAGEAHRARAKLRGDLPDGLRRDHLPDPGILPLHALAPSSASCTATATPAAMSCGSGRAHRGGAPLRQRVLHEARKRLPDRHGALRTRLGLKPQLALRTAVPAAIRAIAAHCSLADRFVNERSSPAGPSPR